MYVHVPYLICQKWASIAACYLQGQKVDEVHKPISRFNVAFFLAQNLEVKKSLPCPDIFHGEPQQGWYVHDTAPQNYILKSVHLCGNNSSANSTAPLECCLPK